MKSFKLDQHPKIKPGFTVPDGYFENFQRTMLQQIEPETKVVPLYRNRKSWWYTAAAAVAVSLSIPAINTLTTKSQTDIVVLDRYFAETELSEEQIVELLETEDIAKIKVDYGLEDAVIEDALQTSPIENYILD